MPRQPCSDGQGVVQTLLENQGPSPKSVGNMSTNLSSSTASQNADELVELSRKFGAQSIAGTGDSAHPRPAAARLVADVTNSGLHAATATSAAASDAADWPLPHPWRECFSERQQRVYYVNSETNHSFLTKLQVRQHCERAAVRDR